MFLCAALSLGVVVAMATLLGRSPAAYAQAKPDPRERLAELNRQALADYAANDFESARLGLREAIILAGRSGLTSDPVMASLWADLGALYINGFRDHAKAQKAFSVAVKLHPNVLPSESMLTPEVRTALKTAGGTAENATGPKANPWASPAPGAAPSPSPGGSPVEPAGGSGTLPPSVAPPGLPSVAPPGESPAPVNPPAPPLPPRRAGPGEPDFPAAIPVALYCPAIDEAPPGGDVVFYCVLQPEIDAKRVTLFFRTPGALSWTTVPTTMAASGWIKAVIPGGYLSESMIGKSLQYYLEAYGADGKPAARAGRDDSPNVLPVTAGAASLRDGVWAGSQGRRRSARAAASPGEGDEDPLRALEEERERERAVEKLHRRRKGALFVSLSGGTGYGWHPEERLEFYETALIASGWIPSGLFFVAPGVGYQINERWAVGVEGRAQFISQKGSGDSQPGSPANRAFLLLGRLQYLLGAGNFQGTASLLAGAGSGFRLTIGPQSDVYRRNDSVRGGPLAAGLGIGATYHLSSHFALVVEGRGLVGFPAAKAVVFDLSGGAVVGF